MLNEPLVFLHWKQLDIANNYRDIYHLIHILFKKKNTIRHGKFSIPADSRIHADYRQVFSVQLITNWKKK